MKKISKILALGILILLPFTNYNKAYAKESDGDNNYELEAPEAGHYFPNDIIDWSLTKYPDQKNNISREALAERYELDGKTENAKKNPGAGVMAITIANEHTKGTASQGSTNYKDGYAFTNWQYVDSMIYWGGSASEGIIVTPAADFTDSAHKNGVKVYGTVFFPPGAYGGKEEWVNDFVKQDENGNYIIADKLIEISKTLGFDGWFLNQETAVSNRNIGKKFQEFMDYYYANSDLELVWYDAMVENGWVSWQGNLNDSNSMFFQKGDKKRSDKIFIDFRWYGANAISAKNKAIELNRNPLDVYFGYDVQGPNFNRTLNSYDSIDDLATNGKLNVSLGFYCPDSAMRNASSLNGEEFWNKVWENEELLWINDKGNLNEKPSYEFGGISTYFPEKTPITSFPFITYFNQGAGENLYINGEILKAGTYYNRSSQDILPTYRWDIINEKSNDIKASLDVVDVFNGGSSLKFYGKTENDGYTDVMLYGTNAIIDDSYAEIIKKGQGNLDLILEFEDGNREIIKGSASQGSWDVVSYDLSAYIGKTVRKLGLRLSADQNDDYKINIGKLQIGQISENPIEISQLNIADSSIKDGVSANVSLEYEISEDNNGVNAYYYDKDANKVFLSYSKNNNIFIKDLKRLDDDTSSIKIALIPLGFDGREIVTNEVNIDFDFGDLAKPKADFYVDKTFAKAGEIIRLKQDDSISTSEYIWEIPGANIERQEGKEIEISFDKAGVYSIRHIAKNKAGEDTLFKKNIITIYDNLPQEVTNLAPLSKSVKTSGYTNSNESPRGAIDENENTKWCDNANDKPYLELDLGKAYTITAFELAHAQRGGESKSMNSRDFYIETSVDGENYDRVVEVKDNIEELTKHQTIAKARFVRLVLDKAEQNGNVARIYEFRVFGFDGEFEEVVKNADELSKLRQTYYDTKLTDKEVSKIDKGKYDEYKDLQDRAEAILDVNEITESDFTLAGELNKAYENLFNNVNKNKLNSKILFAKTLKTDNLTEKSLKDLNEAIIKAQEAMDSPNISQEDIDQAEKELVKVIFNLERINKTSLKSMIDKSNSLNLGLYSEQSSKVLTQALEKAKEIYDNQSVSQEEVDNSLINLTNAYNKLEAKTIANKNKIKSLVAKAKKYELEKYSKKSVESFKESLANAEKVIVDKKASQEEVDMAYNKLLKAMFALR